MTVSLRVALLFVVGSAVTGCGGSGHSERIRILEESLLKQAKELEAQSLAIDQMRDARCADNQQHMLLYFDVIRNEILAHDRWEILAPPEYRVTPIAQFAKSLEKDMWDRVKRNQALWSTKEFTDMLERRGFGKPPLVEPLPYRPIFRPSDRP